MEIAARFMVYAADFEKTLADDDWTRLCRHFDAEAVYEVRGCAFACTVKGREAIFAGMKKSLDGFDRKFSARDIEVTSGPATDGDELRLGWKVTYRRDEVRPFVLQGRTIARYRGDQIVHLSDSFDPGVDAQLEEWQRENGLELDPSYT